MSNSNSLGVEIGKSDSLHVSTARQYLTNKNGRWQTTPFPASLSRDDAFALSPNDTPHMARHVGGNITVSALQASKWVDVSVIPPNGRSTGMPAFAIDSNDVWYVLHPSTAYAAGKFWSAGKLIYTRIAGGTAGGGAVIATPAKKSKLGGYVANNYVVAIDGQGKVHTAWVQVLTSGPTSIRYATNASGSWKDESVIEPFGLASGSPKIAADAKGVHICFFDSTNKALKCAEKTTKGWTFSTLPSATSVFAVEMDNGSPVVIDGSLEVLRYSGAKWSVTDKADSYAGTGHVRFGLGSSGTVHVVYSFRGPTGQTVIRHAWR